MTKKKVFIETYGCQMNVYDTELIKSILTKDGFEIANQERGADIVMLNTCSVRDMHSSVYLDVWQPISKQIYSKILD